MNNDFFFTKLFLKCSDSPIKNPDRVPEELIKDHPFTYPEQYLGLSTDTWNFFSPSNVFGFSQRIKEEELESMYHWESELPLVEPSKRDYYINYCFDQLVRYKREIDRIKVQDRGYHLNFVNDSIHRVILKISRENHLFFNSRNRDYLLSLTTIKEPITAFKLKYKDDQAILSLYNDYLRGTFIDYSQDPLIFLSLFEGRRLEQKINWIDKKNSLWYFIILLRDSKKLQEHKYSRWEVVAEFFLLDGRPLHRYELSSKQPPASALKKNKLENFVNFLPIR